MRAPSLILLGTLVASFTFAFACNEHVPAPLGSTDDGGATSAGDDGGGEPDAGPLPPLESAPPAKIAVGDRKDATSTPVVFDPVRGGVWTANGDVGTVGYVDVDAHALQFEIPVGAAPVTEVKSVALSPDGKWLAAVDRAAGAVVLIEAEARTARRSIPVGTHPRAAVWDAADPRWLYVAVEDTGSVVVIDRTAGAVSATIPVGRLPSGVAVSRRRNELYVTHRTDGVVTVVPLDADADGGAPYVDAASLATADGSDDGAADADVDGAASADAAPPGPAPLAGPLDVALAHEDGDGKATTPHGAPFAFESLAWAADGNVAWIPHELLANTHPFQFQTTLFPAVSVVDLAARAEVQTDPNDPNGVVAGRKNLFAGINVLDPTGNTTVLSQPCAAAFHPNGLAAYVLACGSEDLITFDTTQGIAIDLIRGLPGDHPVGLAMDDTGQRLFVLADQTEAGLGDAGAAGTSKSLAIVDTANGSLLGHPRVIAGPIPTAAKDPVDPDLRAGLRLFYRATSAKGALATTGNDWMSCGACHLDGFVSTNLAFFENLSPADPATDARIGHTGLKDFFSKSPPANDPADPAFDPHDVLVALAEQGGLAPDRSGAKRDGAVDPSAPTADAATMAKQIAKVIGRDLPLGPTWLLPTPGDKPNDVNDAAFCGDCHKAEYAAWQKSAHAHAAVDQMVRFGAGVEVDVNGAQYPRLCAGCHDPVSARLGDTSLKSGRGITCLGCHEMSRLIGAGGNADLSSTSYDWTVNHKERAKASLATLRKPEFCGGCHQQFVPGTGILAITTLTEWQHGPFSPANAATPADAKACVDCHAPKDANGTVDHAMVGGNVYYAHEIASDADLEQRERDGLKKALTISAKRAGNLVVARVFNVGSGHSFPTGVTDVREPWVELQAVDANHTPLARYGGPGADGLIPASAARLGMDIAQPDGTVLLRHELSETTRLPFFRLVPAGGSVELLLDAPATLPAGAVGLDAVLYYRNVRTPYYRAAKQTTGDATSSAPEVEVARAPID